jgi:hypothetical protein
MVLRSSFIRNQRATVIPAQTLIFYNTFLFTDYRVLQQRMDDGQLQGMFRWFWSVCIDLSEL